MGLVSFDELLRLADSDELVGKMKTLAALESMPKIGKVKARRLMTEVGIAEGRRLKGCLLYTSPSPRDGLLSRMPSSA